MALKKIRVQNFETENIRFIAREIMILRRLDHPNIMKLEGIIASRNSNSMYFVFDYMEHDLEGLCSSPDIKFTEAQARKKCTHTHTHTHKTLPSPVNNSVCFLITLINFVFR